MKLDRYQLKSDDQLTTFGFLSEGPKGKIEKVIQFSLVNQHDLYNLSLGDKNSLPLLVLPLHQAQDSVLLPIVTNPRIGILTRPKITLHCKHCNT